VTGDELAVWCTAQANFALMDYVSPADGLDGEVGVQAVNLADVDHALRAFEEFSRYLTYPEGYVEGLRRLEERLRLSPAAVLDVTILTGDERGEFRVTRRPARRVTEEPGARS
jgi:hypothetical protein